MENKFESPRFQPSKVRLFKGKREAWCTCGKSIKPPFCDGTHRETSFKPLKFTPEWDEEALLCNCKYTKNPPYCDCSHEHHSLKQ
jgi:CDGSH-type Zn-finger protein